jgi:hypothetical protein
MAITLIAPPEVRAVMVEALPLGIERLTCKMLLKNG